jgi:hypothetical protein
MVSPTKVIEGTRIERRKRRSSTYSWLLRQWFFKVWLFQALPAQGMVVQTMPKQAIAFEAMPH